MYSLVPLLYNVHSDPPSPTSPFHSCPYSQLSTYFNSLKSWGNVFILTVKLSPTYSIFETSVLSFSYLCFLFQTIAFTDSNQIDTFSPTARRTELKSEVYTCNWNFEFDRWYTYISGVIFLIYPNRAFIIHIIKLLWKLQHSLEAFMQL